MQPNPFLSKLPNTYLIVRKRSQNFELLYPVQKTSHIKHLQKMRQAHSTYLHVKVYLNNSTCSMRCVVRHNFYQYLSDCVNTP
jgi:hypothetical protein